MKTIAAAVLSAWLALATGVLLSLVITLLSTL
jgi:hypothetical protein